MPKKDEPGRHDRDECQLCKEIDAKVAAGLAESAWPFPTTVVEEREIVWTPEMSEKAAALAADLACFDEERKATED